MTNVTIRGIDDETYLKFSAQATLQGVSIGDLTTRAMRALLEKDQGPIYRIGNMEDISINRTDLESLDGVVIISNVDSLTFEQDVDWPLFQKRIKSIENVDTLTVPKGLSKFQVLTKARNVGKISSA